MYATEECFDFSDSYVKQLLAVLTIPLKIFVAMLPKLLSVTCPYYIFKINYLLFYYLKKFVKEMFKSRDVKAVIFWSENFHFWIGFGLKNNYFINFQIFQFFLEN